MKDQEIDDLFAKGLKDAESPAPAGLWAKIEAELPPTEATAKKPLVLWRYFAAAAVLLLCLGIGFRFFDAADPNLQAEGKAKLAQAEVTEPAISAPQQEAPVAAAALKPDVPQETTVKKKTAASKPGIVQLAKQESKPEVTPAALAQVETPRINHTAPLEAMPVLLEITPEESLNSTTAAAMAEVKPIQPLVNIIENEELMYAQQAKEEKKPRQSLLTKVLNGIAGNINLGPSDVQFSNDEEGNIRIDLTKSLARNRR